MLKITWKVHPRSLSEIPIPMRLIIPNIIELYVQTLKCYLIDLEQSMEKISGLYDDAKIPLSLTNTDLQLVKEALTKIPDCEYTSDENE